MLFTYAIRLSGNATPVFDTSWPTGPKVDEVVGEPPDGLSAD